MTTGADADEVFERHRGLLQSLAYQLLGSVTDAEDVVQEAWLRWSRVDPGEVTSPRAYLTRLTTRAAVDHLRHAQRRRQTYVGPWLPEPLLTAPDVADDVTRADSVSMAMLVVLETLSPLERAVFVLREVFAFSHAEIADALDRSEPAIRQVAHRARAHVHARQPRYATDRAVRRQATERFLSAAMGGDLAELLAVLAPDVTFWADGGGKVTAPRRPIYGADKVARFLAARASAIPAGTEVDLVEANGGPAAVLRIGDVTYAVFILDLAPASGLIETIRLIANPDKLAHSALG
ncbi:RNA polymerase sigma-70 factor [Actinopolymorpha alba]|uniref:RNA polymerase sigma-70 factor n=1 Tax=Actinopolymorpha alba TaxID=533267 RepID=UPI00037E98F0|nr:RNA polymerase sigma-70 factor [Actinopolymorpha alba]